MKAKLITPEGFETLREELDFLWRKKRPEVTKVVQWAAALGDRSENAEYKESKRQLREIDRRVRYLRKCLENLEIIRYSPVQAGKVFFGAWVEVENEDEEVLSFRIVGGEEIDHAEGYISIDSPMARALLKKQVDDEVTVRTPSGTKVWFINRIWYLSE